MELRAWLDKHVRLIFAVALALFVLSHLPSLSNPFVYDDEAAIVHNEYLRTTSGLVHLLTKSGWDSEGVFAGYYRPLTMALFWVDYQLGGLDPQQYRATNLFFHALNACLLYLLFGVLLRRLDDSLGENATRWVAAVSTLAFVVHPVFATGVYFIYKRSAVMVTTFYLVAFLAVAAALYAPSLRRRIVLLGAAIFAFALALGARESGVTFAAIVTLAVLGFRDQPHRWRYRAMVAGLFWLGAAAYLVSYPIGVINYYGVDSLTYLYQQATIIPQYLVLLVWPTRALISYGDPPVYALTDLEVLLGGALILALLVTAVALWKRQRLISFSLLFFFCAISPGSSFIPGILAMDHIRLYLAAAPLLLLLCWGFARLARDRVRKPLVPAALATALLLALVASHLTMGKRWSSPVALWTSVVSRYPNYARGWANLCGALGEKDIKGKLAVCHKAWSLERKNIYPFLIIIDIYERARDLDRAEKLVARGARIFGSHPRFLRAVGSLAYAQQDYPRAITLFRAAVAKRPQHTPTQLRLAQALARAKQREALATVMQIVARRTLGDSRESAIAGWLEIDLGRTERARRYFSQALVHGSRDRLARIGSLRCATPNPSALRTLDRIAKETSLLDVVSWSRLLETYRAWGAKRRYARHLERLHRRHPRLAEVNVLFIRWLASQKRWDDACKLVTSARRRSPRSTPLAELHLGDHCAEK
jgi:tetratricopeptide (TPR) repeat protein